MSKASSRFAPCVRAAVERIRMPVGKCRRITAVSTLLTFCPPLPPERVVVISMSFSLISILISLDTSGVASMEANEVWRFAFESNGEIRTRRCTPRSFFKKP